MSKSPHTPEFRAMAIPRVSEWALRGVIARYADVRLTSKKTSAKQYFLRYKYSHQEEYSMV